MNNNYQQTIQGRLKSLGIFAILLTFVLFWKMIDIQGIKHEHYLELAQGQQRFEKTETAARGKIYVHDSAVNPDSYYPLAFDVKKFAVWVVPRNTKNKEKTANQLAPLLSIPESDIFNKINNDKLYIPALKRGLSLDEANKIIGRKISGVYVTTEYSRNYPEGNLASQLLGFVNAEGEGKYGFEGHYNDELKGKDGTVTGEKDTLGRIISLLGTKEPQDGASYVLTIDRSVQYFVETKLKQALTDYQAEAGTVVIMDIKTGGILAMASTPSFDPNTFKQQAESDPALFMNPATTYLFEPGSIFKPIIMASALDKGVVTPETENTFGKTVTVQGYTIGTALDKAYGKETMTQVLQNSDNVAMVWLASQMNKEDIYSYIKKFNFLDRTGIDLDTEVAGKVLPVKQWKEINQATVAFGQGISVTPIGMVSAYAAIANGGKYIYPHVVDKVLLPDGTEKKMEKQEGERVISEQTSSQIREMLYNVVMNGSGKRAQVPGFRIAAKTGTAQIANPDGSGYLDSEDKLGIYNHSAAGLAPVDAPRFAMLVKLVKPKSSKFAESTSVPLFGQIASFLLNYHYRVAPTEPVQ